jgi:hypothetical protein
MKIQATRAFRHAGEVIEPLAVLEVPDDFARALIHWDKARVYSEPEQSEPEAAAPAAPETPRRGRKASA